MARAAPAAVVAATDGLCIGGALDFAASCVVRLTTDRSRFGTPQVEDRAATNAGTLLLPLGAQRGFPTKGCATEQFEERIAALVVTFTARPAPRSQRRRRC